MMLRRPTYIGVHYFNRNDSRTRKPKAREEWVAVPVPRLVEDDVFHAVQAQLDARHPKLTPPRIVNSEILLTGIARCEACGAQMRMRTGKGGRYRYYACSRKVDSGVTACSGGAVPMKELDDLVTDAICERVLEPRRMQTMVGSLIARNARHQDRGREELRELFARQRDLQKSVSNLVDVMEQGGLDAMQSVQDRLAKRQDELDQVNRLITFKRRVLETPIADVSPQKARRSQRLCGPGCSIKTIRPSGALTCGSCSTSSLWAGNPSGYPVQRLRWRTRSQPKDRYRRLQCPL
jgi:hypothetical protein